MANVFEKPQQAGFLEKLGTVLGGFGAGYQGRGTQFLQQQQAQRQQLSLERQKAAAEDMLKAKRLIEEGRLEDLRDLGFDRARIIEKLGGDSSDTRRIIDLTNYAMLGDKNSLDMLNSEINDGLYMAQQQGLIKGAPVQEWQDVIENGRVVGQRNPITNEMKYLANQPQPQKSPERKILTDAAGNHRFVDTGEKVFDVETPQIRLMTDKEKEAANFNKDDIVQIDPKGNYKVIKEGATPKELADAKKVKQENLQAYSSTKETIDLIDSLLNHKGLASAVGPVDSKFFTVAEDTLDFESRLRQLQGRVFLEAFQSLQGGGTITEVEGEKAEQAKARIGLNQSEESFKTALKDLRQDMQTKLMSLKTKDDEQDIDALVNKYGN